MSAPIPLMVGTVTGSATVDIRPYVTNIVFSLDADRVPFFQATVTLEDPPKSIRDQCDPRRSTGAILKFRVGQYNVATMFPDSINYQGNSNPGDPAVAYIQRTDWDTLTGVFTIQAGGVETRLMDKRRLAGNTLDTAAATLAALVSYSMVDVFGAGSAATDYTTGAGAVALPAGDRRLMQIGESHWDLLEGELNAQGWRLFGDADGRMALAARSDPPRDKSFSGYTGIPFAAVPGTINTFPVESVVQTLDRSGWADGVLARFTYLNGAGVQTVGYQRSGSGANTRGVVYDYQRTPSAVNVADGIQSRTIKRGSSYKVIAQSIFGARPGLPATIIRSTGTESLGTIRATEWDLAADMMTITTEVPAP